MTGGTTQVELPLLAVRDLAVSFDNPGGARTQAVDGNALTVYANQTVAVVGESGCGKSVSALSTLGLIPKPSGRVDRGQIMFRRKDGRVVDLLTISEREMLEVRGAEIAMIFQEPMTSLNPVETVGEQIVEAVRLHRVVKKQDARRLAVAAMTDVGIAEAEKRFSQYPHQFSGGMRQRIMIAMALACEPRLLLADEPTTALDVTIQAQILELLRVLREQRGLGVVLITHDLGVVAENADVVCVMYGGRVVEYAAAEELFERPLHPYTRGLLACIPRGDDRRERLATVREFVEGSGYGVDGGAAGTFPAWWPLTAAPAGAAGYVLAEVGKDHWVGLWKTESAAQLAARAPDLAYRRGGLVGSGGAVR